jgi:hypothetical protein
MPRRCGGRRRGASGGGRGGRRTWELAWLGLVVIKQEIPKVPHNGGRPYIQRRIRMCVIEPAEMRLLKFKFRPYSKAAHSHLALPRPRCGMRPPTPPPPSRVVRAFRHFRPPLPPGGVGVVPENGPRNKTRERAVVRVLRDAAGA